MDFGRLLAVSASVFQLWPFMHILLTIPRTYTPPSPRETTQKSYLVTTCGSKSSFSGLCSVFFIRSRYGYSLTPNIEWWSMDRITTMTHSEKGRMENIAATVHRKHKLWRLPLLAAKEVLWSNFVSAFWMGFPYPLSFCPPSESFSSSIISHGHLWIGQCQIVGSIPL